MPRSQKISFLFLLWITFVHADDNTCSDSNPCFDDNYCDFRYGVEGVCESCEVTDTSTLQSVIAKCEFGSFQNARGVVECIKTCSIYFQQKESKKCSDTNTECEEDHFCNLDADQGVCQSCLDLPDDDQQDTEQICALVGFIDPLSRAECERECNYSGTACRIGASSCGKGWFCDFSNGFSGQCQKCFGESGSSKDTILELCDSANFSQIRGTEECYDGCSDYYTFCSSEVKCNDDSFCNFDSINEGQCESCDSFAQQGNKIIAECESREYKSENATNECKEVCSRYQTDKLYCSNDKPNCGEDQFCNFELGNEGFCENCLQLIGDSEQTMMSRCNSSDFLHPKGKYSCYNNCAADQLFLNLCKDNNLYCGENRFCYFEFSNLGQCRNCTASGNDFEAVISSCDLLPENSYKLNCKEACSIFNADKVYCNRNINCNDGWFCNYELGVEGFCERCDQLPGDNLLNMMSRCDSKEFFYPKSIYGCYDGCVAIKQNSSVCTDESAYCGKDRFCNFELGVEGTCESCNSFPNIPSLLIEACDANDFKNEKGTIECKEICSIYNVNSLYCNENSDCGDGSFCNFDFGIEGFCKKCDIFPGNDIEKVITECQSETSINIKGQTTCKEVCSIYNTDKAYCNSDISCGDGRFCNFNFGSEGFCEGCIDLPGDFTQNMISRCDDMNLLNLKGTNACYDSCVAEGDIFESCSDEISYCGEGRFCNFDLGVEGECENCAIVGANDVEVVIDGCNSEGLSSMKGTNECKNICTIYNGDKLYCNEDVNCADGWFCNFEYGVEGICERCENLPGDTMGSMVTRCSLASLDPKGTDACNNVCARSDLNPFRCSDDSPFCGENRYCDFGFGFDGECQSCLDITSIDVSQNSMPNCDLASFLNPKGLVNCRNICESRRRRRRRRKKRSKKSKEGKL